MGDLTFNQLCGEKIRKARNAKGMSAEELAYSLNKDEYEKTLKLIKYWEKGNGYPDLNQIYKLAEIIEIDPNEIFELRENGRKKLSEKKQLSDRQVKIRDRIEANFEDFEMLFPVFLVTIIIVFVLGGLPLVLRAFNIMIHPISTLKEILSGLFRWINL